MLVALSALFSKQVWKDFRCELKLLCVYVDDGQGWGYGVNLCAGVVGCSDRLEG